MAEPAVLGGHHEDDMQTGIERAPVSELGHIRLVPLIEPDPQVCAMLARLREAGRRPGAVTNGMVDNQTNKLHRAGLYDLVDAVVISGAVEIRKPDARIFRHALARLGAEPGPHAVMVGDSLESDIAGTHRAGLTTVWVSHGRPLADTETRPQHIIQTVTEAAAVLKQPLSAPR
ncbi:HAD family hydrolase [Streptomyces sp. XH2]|uniref:HAD family hydrolase n=1 Tax=Streptomyces sp. XH2 TaxID=3412483 RepID=UPI003C7BA501